jgi:hypothetical protein
VMRLIVPVVGGIGNLVEVARQGVRLPAVRA